MGPNLLHNCIETWNEIVLDAATNLKRTKKQTVKTEKIKCNICGRSECTLRRDTDGNYICNDCHRNKEALKWK